MTSGKMEKSEAAEAFRRQVDHSAQERAGSIIPKERERERAGGEKKRERERESE